jgi:hypothetical protein
MTAVSWPLTAILEKEEVSNYDIVYCLNYLARILSAQGNPAGAELIYKRFLDIWEESSGLQNDNISQVLAKLVEVSNTQGKTSEVKKYAKRLQALKEKKQADEENYK